jgi:hypothetical protein
MLSNQRILKINVILDVTPFIAVDTYVLSGDRLCVHVQRVHTHRPFIWEKLDRGRSCPFHSTMVKKTDA